MATLETHQRALDRLATAFATGETWSNTADGQTNPDSHMRFTITPVDGRGDLLVEVEPGTDGAYSYTLDSMTLADCENFLSWLATPPGDRR